MIVWGPLQKVFPPPLRRLPPSHETVQNEGEEEGKEVVKAWGGRGREGRAREEGKGAPFFNKREGEEEKKKLNKKKIWKKQKKKPKNCFPKITSKSLFLLSLFWKLLPPLLAALPPPPPAPLWPRGTRRDPRLGKGPSRGRSESKKTEPQRADSRLKAPG